MQGVRSDHSGLVAGISRHIAALRGGERRDRMMQRLARTGIHAQVFGLQPFLLRQLLDQIIGKPVAVASALRRNRYDRFARRRCLARLRQSLTRLHAPPLHEPGSERAFRRELVVRPAAQPHVVHRRASSARDGLDVVELEPPQHPDRSTQPASGLGRSRIAEAGRSRHRRRRRSGPGIDSGGRGRAGRLHRLRAGQRLGRCRTGRLRVPRRRDPGRLRRGDRR